jgi:hypothetical protein
MCQPNLATPLILFALGILSCAPRAPVTPSLPPIPEEARPTAPVKYLVLSPGNYRYRFTQMAEIVADDSGSGATPSLVSTTALFHVGVSRQGDSSFSATISIDSLSITPQGSIPQPPVVQVQRIDSLLQAVLSPSHATSHSQLPDSLCAYASFISTANLILLPELALQLDLTSQKTYSDTARGLSCRAGAHVESLTTRHLRRSLGDLTELALEQRTDLNGAGLLRQDSVRISGSVLTHGTASFRTDSRLPSLILTTSEGIVTVQLGPNRTVFRQTSNQEIRLDSP